MKTILVEILGIVHEVQYQRNSKTIESAIQEAVKVKNLPCNGKALVTINGEKTQYRFVNCGRRITKEMKAVRYYQVTYDKKVGSVGTMVVRAMNEEEALKYAAFCCFTGSNFRDAKEVEKQLTFSELHFGRCGSNRANR